MSNYKKVTSNIIVKLQIIVGVEHVLSGTAILDHYAYDAGTRKDILRYPEIVVLPGSSQEVAEIMKLANKHLIPVTPRGGGSGLAGGAVALKGGILLDLARMNRIIHVDIAAKYMIVEAAVRTLDIQNEAKRHGLLYAGDPCSSDDCVIAGNVATNAGGNKAVKYGVTADQVYELEIVTPQGKILNLGGRLKKNSTGYSLIKLIAGSEGTLGIITKITLKLQKLAPLLPNFLAIFPNLATAVTLVEALLAEKNALDTTSLELMDRHTVIAIENYQKTKIFYGDVGDVLLIQLEAQTQEDVKVKELYLQELCSLHNCLDIRSIEGEAIWRGRRQWGKALEVDEPIGASEDLVVPVDLITPFIQNLESLTTSFQFDFRIAGHAGDGNLHLRILPGTVPIEEWENKLKEFREVLYAVTYSLGGRLSGEHGIGFKRKYFLRSVIQPDELELMKNLKKAFDPNFILNPGKIFDIDAS
jgi:glycolate oxidase